MTAMRFVKSFFVFFLTAFTFLLAACDTDVVCSQIDSDDGAILLTASLQNVADQTRTTYVSQGEQAGINVAWENSDQICVYGLTSFKTQVFLSEGSNNKVSLWKGNDPGYKNGESVVGIYPVSSLSGTSAVCDFSGQDGSLALFKRYDLMISGQSTIDSRSVSLSFAHVNAFLRIEVEKALVSGTNGLSFLIHGTSLGQCSFDVKTRTYTISGADMLTINCTTAPDSDDTYYYYYIVIPALDSDNPLQKIELKQDDVLIKAITYQDNQSIEAGKVYLSSFSAPRS